MTQKMTRREVLASGAALAVAATVPNIAHAQNATTRATTSNTEKKSAMKLGLISYNVAKDWDLNTVLKNCKAAGVEGFEARTTHAHGIEPTLSDPQRQEVKKKFEDAGVTLWGFGSVCEFHSPDPAVVQKNIEDCKAFVLLAKDTGAKGVKVRPNGLRKDVPAEKTLEQIGTALRTCGQFAQEHNVEIWLEVHGAETQKPANIKRIMEVCNHPSVGACWNSNGTDVENGSVKANFELLRPHIKSCHINDLWGNYPYRELFQLLKASNYDRFTLCEVGAPVTADSGATFLKCYRGLWNELQRA